MTNEGPVFDFRVGRGSSEPKAEVLASILFAMLKDATLTVKRGGGSTSGNNNNNNNNNSDNCTLYDLLSTLARYTNPLGISIATEIDNSGGKLNGTNTDDGGRLVFRIGGVPLATTESLVAGALLEKIFEEYARVRPEVQILPKAIRVTLPSVIQD